MRTRVRRCPTPPEAFHAAHHSVRRVHVIFKTHLDLGFSDFAATIEAKYFDHYIPEAIKLAEQMRQSEHGAPGDSPGHTPDRFIWTTGSWLIYEYLERANSTARRRMEEAIAIGDIAWHALPFTTFSEDMDASMFRFGLSLSQGLDRRFGRHTIAGKMTDVPGHTRAIVPLLAEAGVQFLHLGVNPGCTPPDVPPVFVWQDPDSGAEVVVMYQIGYGHLGDKLMAVPGMADAIAFAHTDDNVGPQSMEQVQKYYREMRDQFPGAEVFASTMDAYAAHLPEVRDNLPVITQEIGDTWIHAVGADPRKESQYRELLRMRRVLRERGTPEEDLHEFSRNLLMVAEHTQGLDVKTHLGDWTNYRAGGFRAARRQENFKKMEASWQEQRAYVHAAVEALPSLLKREAVERLAALVPERPDRVGFVPVSDVSQPFELAQFSVAFDPQLGCLTRLKMGEVDWAGPDNPLGKFWYETFSAADYERFKRQYLTNQRGHQQWGSIPDFTKPGIEDVAREHKIFLPRLTWAGKRVEEDRDTFLFVMEMPAESHREYGAPSEISLQATFDRLEPVVEFDLQWFSKSASRLPEAAWLSFVPSDRDRSQWRRQWRMEKLGQWISPYEVIRNGNRHLHAVGGGVRAADARHEISIQTLDAALVAPGRPSLLDFNNRQPDLRQGLHFNLHNNIWGTNSPMWYEDDARFRFVLRVSRS